MSVEERVDLWLNERLEPYQLRVLAESIELKTKVEKLESFINGPQDHFVNLRLEDQDQLIYQLNFMRGYLSVLEARVRSFYTKMV